MTILTKNRPTSDNINFSEQVPGRKTENLDRNSWSDPRKQ